MIGEVLPTIDTTYTRGGGIVGLAFHKDAKGDSEPKYLWAIDLETFGGSWFEARLELQIGILAANVPSSRNCTYSGDMPDYLWR